MNSIDEIEAELSRRIATCHSAREDATNTRQRDKQGARAQALSEMLAWVRFQRKIRDA